MRKILLCSAMLALGSAVVLPSTASAFFNPFNMFNNNNNDDDYYRDRYYWDRPYGGYGPYGGGYGPYGYGAPYGGYGPYGYGAGPWGAPYGGNNQNQPAPPRLPE